MFLLDAIVGRTVKAVGMYGQNDREQADAGRFDSGFIITFDGGPVLLVGELSESGMIETKVVGGAK